MHKQLYVIIFLLSFIGNNTLVYAPIQNPEIDLSLVKSLSGPMQKKYKRLIFARERRRLHHTSLMNWFGDEVKKWSQSMHNVLLDNTLGSHNLLLMKLQSLYKKVENNKNDHQAVVLLQDLLKIYEVFQKSQLNGTDYDMIEYFHGVILVKSSLLLVHSMTMSIVQILDVLVEYHEYWTGQERHPWRYYFHKSPLKWFNKKSQYEEITTNKNVIASVIEKYDQVLGRLIHFIHTFDAKNSVDKQYMWLDSLMDIINVITASHYEKKIEVHGFEKTIHAMINHYSRVPQHAQTLLTRIEKAKKPHHIIRHWIAYMALGGLATYCYLDPHTLLTGFGVALFDWYSKKDKEGNNFIERWVINPAKEFKNVVLEQQGNTIIQVDNSIKIRNEIAQELSSTEKGEDALTRALASSDDLLQKNIEDVVNRIAVGKTPQEKENIVRAMINSQEIEPLLAYITPINKSSSYTLAWGKSVVPDNTDQVIAQMADAFSSGKVNLIKKALLNDLTPTLIQIKTNILKVQLALFDDLIEGIKNTNTGFKKHDLSVKILALVPAGLAGFGLFKGLHKIYNRIVHHDYRMVNNLLCDVEKVLIKSEDIMDYTLYGRLIHLLHQLKISVYACIPIKNDMRYKFIADIQELESYDFTPREKEKLIVLMRQRYTFLQE